jgi:amino-acid N-acetyltransferase
MERDIRIVGATAGDLPAIKQLLIDNDLPTAGVDEHWRTFVIARDGDAVVACGGSEAHELTALLRSIAVHSDYRSLGIGRKIVRQLLDRLASRGIREFYLLTTTAQEYFRKRGFKVIDRDEVHPQLLGSEEFRGACPDSAVCMRLVMLA